MAIESLIAKQKRAKKIVAKLRADFPIIDCPLLHESPYQLLVATLLSAQCTDARVNKVTPELFRLAPTPQSMIELEIPEIETLIRSTGFFRNKAKNIFALSQELVTKYSSKVPQSMEALSALPGIGRKTANVVLGQAFNIPGMVVDTHVTRLTNRLKLAKGTNAVKLEKTLEPLVERKDWSDFSLLLIFHGRKTCLAHKVLCDSCVIARECPSRGLAPNAWKIALRS